MTFTALSKPLLLAVGASLLAFGCSTPNQPELSSTPSAAPALVATPNAEPAPAAEGAVVQPTEAPKPKAVVPAQPETAFGGIVVPEPRPAMQIETPTMSPAFGMAWVPGAWVWRGQWIWQRGHWTRPPHPGAVWMAPQYFDRDGRHIYIPGSWR